MADWHEWVPEDKRGDMQKAIDRAVADRVKSEKAKQDALDAALKVREKEVAALRGEVDGYKGKLSEYEGQIRTTRAQTLAQRLGLDPAHAGRAFELLESEHGRIFADQKDAPAFDDWAAGLSTDEGRAHEPSQFAARILVGFRAEPAATGQKPGATGQKEGANVQKPGATVQTPNRNAGATVTPAIVPKVDTDRVMAEIRQLRVQSAGAMKPEQRADILARMQALQESLAKQA